jgi:hypothetical protein
MLDFIDAFSKAFKNELSFKFHLFSVIINSWSMLHYPVFLIKILDKSSQEAYTVLFRPKV